MVHSWSLGFLQDVKATLEAYRIEFRHCSIDITKHGYYYTIFVKISLWNWIWYKKRIITEINRITPRGVKVEIKRINFRRRKRETRKEK